MKQPIWVPSEERIKNANMTKYMQFVNKQQGKNFSNYSDLYEWSVTNLPEFWETVWDFLDIKASKKYDKVMDDLNKFPGVKWFDGAKMNFAENLLRYKDDKTAFIFKCETKQSVYISYEELYKSAGTLSWALRNEGITQNDRVVGYMPNIPETAIAMLAATTTGATWASCGSELGVQAVIDRFSQIEPKVMFTVDGYFYKNKPFQLLPMVKTIIDEVPSIRKVVFVPYADESPDISGIDKTILYKDFLATGDEKPPVFEQVPASHPVYIMFSSGTTGKPKCMVQSVGGILLNHMKELIIHSDLKREDTFLYMTAPSWMMWNWLISGLSVGCRVVLFDGNPAYPDIGAMWKFAEEEKISFFGTSATYINLLKGQDYRPGEHFDLSAIKSMGQTGSPLSAEGFEFVYEHITNDVHFNSLSGGTDINGCFAIGTPILPVYAGQLQCPALGMRIKSYDEKGNHVYDKQGELVCEAPAPSMPIYFLNDDDNLSRYKDAYFGVYPNKWRHGDYVEFYSDTGGITFFGRSDAILKPSGVRIGTAEIYNIVDKFKEVADSVVIGQNWEGDQRVILFLKLTPGAELNEELQNKIKKTLRDKASPRHVPALIFEVQDVPYTFSAKKVESAITNIMNNRPVTNRDALSNPKCLDEFEKIAKKLK